MAILTWQCRFTACNKRIALVGNVGNGGSSVYVDRRYIGNLCTFFNFAANLKLLEKGKVLMKILKNTRSQQMSTV